MARLGLKQLLGVDEYLEIKKKSKKKTLKIREKKFIKGADSDEYVSTDPLSDIDIEV